MNKFLFLFTFCLAGQLSFAQSPGNRRRLGLMNQIASNCSFYLKEIKLPLPNGRGDAAVHDFRNVKQWFERDCKALKAIDPRALTSSDLIKGKPFGQIVSSARQLIVKNEATLSQIESAPESKIRMIPQHELDLPVKIACSAGQAFLLSAKDQNGGGYYSRKSDGKLAESQSYRSYQEKRREAREVLDKASEEVRANFLQIENEIETLLKADAALAEKNAAESQMAKTKAEKKAAADAETAKVQQEKADLDFATTAALFNLEGVQKGINASIGQLERGTIEASALKRKLIVMSNAEKSAYAVKNPVGDFVVYEQKFSERAYEENPNLKPLRFAIPKNPEQFYREGAPLNAGIYFQFLGIETFGTVGGSETQIPVFKQLSKP